MKFHEQNNQLCRLLCKQFTNQQMCTCITHCPIEQIVLQTTLVFLYKKYVNPFFFILGLGGYVPCAEYESPNKDKVTLLLLLN